MDNLKEEAKPAVENLLESDVDGLFEKLGINKKAEERNDPMVNSFSAEISYDPAHMGIRDDLVNFGKRFYENASKQCYGLFCGNDSENSEEREKISAAFGVGKAEVAAVIAAVLVAQFAWAPAVAAVIAALTIKLVFRPGYEAMCSVWKEKLE